MVIWLVIKLLLKLQVLNSLQQKNSESKTEIQKEKYISPDERQQIIDELRFM